MPNAYIALGSNLGDRAQHLINAHNALALITQTHIIKTSPLYQTPPLGPQDQPDFYNAVVHLQTSLTPHNLLTNLQQIESNLHRTRTRYQGPRTIDLDLLLYNDQIINTPHLTIPHPQMHNRIFVLKPLADIAPTLTHPSLNKTISKLLNKLPPAQIKTITTITSPNWPVNP